MIPRYSIFIFLISCTINAQGLDFLDAELTLVPEQSASITANTQPTLGFVPGAIFGFPLAAPKLALSSPGHAKISFPLYLTEPLFDELSSTSINNSMLVNPKDTRIARAASGGFVSGPDSFQIGGGFKSERNGNDLVLLYVNQPCTIKGTQNLQSDNFTFNLEFARAGFHWISIDSDGNVRNTRVLQPVRYELFFNSVSDKLTIPTTNSARAERPKNSFPICSYRETRCRTSLENSL